MRTHIISALFFGFIFFQVNLLAQDQNEAQTLMGGKNAIKTEDLGFFVAPAYGISEMDGSTASLFQLRGGLSVKDKLSFGGYFTSSVNEIRPQSETIPTIYMDYWTVGAFAEYTLFSKKIVHVTFPIFFGYGEVQMDNESGEAGLGEANFFQIEPSALVEVNLHKYVRLNLGASYRFLGEMQYRNLNQNDISDLTGYIGLKFGLFK
jgi:hypothetical protein